MSTKNHYTHRKTPSGEKTGHRLPLAFILLALQVGMVIVMFNLEKPNTL